MSTSAGVIIRGPLKTDEGHDVVGEILTRDAQAFLAELHHRFESRRRALLKRRDVVQAEIARGKLPDFLPETESVRRADWKVAPIPNDLLDRRVEITGPTHPRKMVLGALNSGANCFMADFEDALAPTWNNLIEGQINMRDAAAGTISVDDRSGKVTRLKDKHAIALVRPRGWHLVEAHLLVDGEPISASLFDFGLHFFHNARTLLKRGSGPYFYLPKMESHLEARLWNDVFNFSQEALNIPKGSIRATVLIETILAAFEMDEILYELRDHSAGLNCGRWDYIFSYIKKFANRPDFVTPDRAKVTMQSPFMQAYVKLLIATCHRRGIHAMGGMAAQIPIKGDDARNNAALDKVRSDKLYEVQAGHDGTWVAHPALIPVAKRVFDQHMKGPNQISKQTSVSVSARDLVEVPRGLTVTDPGVRGNISVAIQYISAWIGGLGAVAINNLMEDAATAEISRTQLWSWIRHGIKLEDGRTITRALVERFITEESRALRAAAPKGSFIGEATDLLRKLVFADRLPDFLTLVAYGRLVTLANEPIVHSTDLNIQAELDSIEQFLHKPRFAHLTRPYTAEDVLRLRGSIVAPHASNFLAQKAWNMFKEFQRTKQYSRTFGCLDPVQVVQMAKYLSTVYVSGWQSSSTASTTNEPGPDFADYPYNTVPNKVDQLFKAQLFHDRKQRNERASMSTEELARTPLVDYLRPIIADGDTGHGGVTAVMKLMKEFIEAGAAGVHFEDQRAGAKKCGHMGGKVLVSTQEHIDRLCAARLQADIMGVETLIVARTDAEAATLIDTDIDPRDQFFILGTTREDLPPLHRMLATSDPRDMDKLTNEWLKDAKLSTFFDAVSAELSSRNDKAKLSEWTSKAKGLGWHDSRDLADRLGLKGFFWCADKARTREGFFRLKCGVDTGVARAVAYAPYADLLWLETAKPSLSEAVHFAEGVRSVYPNALLAYNLSPSFNWSAQGMTDKEIEEYTDKLSHLGYVWQFITLAGFHADALAIDVFAREYAKRKMLAYVELVQRPEGKEGVETLKHQKWSGALLLDNQMTTITGGASSTTSMSHGVTENQFAAKL